MQILSAIWDFFQTEILGMQWLNRLLGNILTALGLDPGARIGGSVQFFLFDTVKILVLLSVLIFISGMCINGAQNGLQAYSPAYYQTEIRATGVSWMHGIGRTGAILSSTLGGMLMLAVPGHSSIFLVLALPACLAGICILLHRMNHAKARLTEAELDALSSPLEHR